MSERIDEVLDWLDEMFPSPRFGVQEEMIDGKKVWIPLMEQVCGTE